MFHSSFPCSSACLFSLRRWPTAFYSREQVQNQDLCYFLLQLGNFLSFSSFFFKWWRFRFSEATFCMFGTEEFSLLLLDCPKRMVDHILSVLFDLTLLTRLHFSFFLPPRLSQTVRLALELEIFCVRDASLGHSCEQSLLFSHSLSPPVARY